MAQLQPLTQDAPREPADPRRRTHPVVAFDARDAFVAMPHGSGLYVRRLLEALRPRLGATLWALDRPGWRGPEVVWEQVGLPIALLRTRPSLIHGPDSFLPLRRGCPGVLTVHDLSFLALPGDMPARTERKYRALVPRCARSAQRVICPSQFTADDLERRCRVPRERIRVIAEAPALPAGSLEPPPGPYVLAAGDLRPKKNLAVLVDAFRRLTAEGLPHRLLLAGADLGSGRALRQRAVGTPLELLGFVSDARLDALLRGADALVLPSLYEGFGLAALDAMARGCPVVLARAGALPEVGGDAAAFFDPHDAGDLTAVLRTVLGSTSERSRLSAAGRARAAGFTWDRTAEATIAVYEELL